ncbi:hypothetical protein Q3G72_006805 [Acer saccharum]|nr:hypothetical protein Q3G72_006805 [Acer saccharum]
MNNIGLLIVCPLSPYLEQELENSFKVFKIWQFEDRNQFFNTQGNPIRAVVSSSPAGADAELIETLPNLEIVSSCSVGLDKIDLVKCPKGVLINVGRGLLVDEPELVAALVEGWLGSAGLDVFENEPEVPEELFGLENVVLLPHVSSGMVETRKAMADLVLGKLKAHFTNKPLLSPVV